ncbi:MAG: sensor domain-containing diguanylate cyclase [Firmicutes bacterium]|nr:sensor domain-containing diguanylate cyclase [Bacillota bacterium]
MRNNDRTQHIILITSYVAKGIAILLFSIFLIMLFSEGGHFSHPHFLFVDYILFFFIPIMYGFGVFYSSKNQLLNGILIFISYFGFNTTLNIAENNTLLTLQYTYLLIPSILYVSINLFKRHEDVRKEEFNRLFGEFEHLSQNYKIVQSMLDITPAMLKDDNLDNLLQLILEKAIEIIPKAQTGSILIREKDQMVFRAAVGYDIDLLKKVNLHFEDMYQYKLGNLLEPQVIQDIKTFNEKNLDAKKTQDLQDQDALIAKSVLTCAITVRGEVYGFINLDNIEDLNAFHDKDKIYIKHLAQQIEMALKNQMLVEDLYKLSRYDSLTGAYTRKQHQMLLKDLYDKSKKSETPFSICALDINNLKIINDSYGHEIGDAYLVHFSKLVKEHIKEIDIFSRTGGDEFMLVYTKCNKLCSEKRMREFKERIEQFPLIIGSKSIPVSFSCGIATYLEDSKYLDELISLSDKNLYLDKKNKA